MLPALIQRPGQIAASRPRERGITLLLVAVAMFGIITMAGLSIDLGTLYQASAEAQRAADAGALAAARVLSASGMTGDPANSSSTWAATCTNATQIAQAVAGQNNVGGAPPSSVTVVFSASDGTDCSAVTATAFGVNPMVTVKVTQSSLPTYFSRIWGRSGHSASASATAEAFNPSGSSNYGSGSTVPVQPRCVKPWIVANYDPLHPAPTGTAPNTYCTDPKGANPCDSLISSIDGTITHGGILGSGIIGETFWLVADCLYNTPNCQLRDAPPQANTTKSKHPHAEDPPDVEYLPGQTSFTSVAVSTGSTCSNVTGNYAQAIAGCDQNTKYQCGVQKLNNVDLTENPSPNDTPNGVQCLIHQQGNGGNGQDILVFNTTSTPPVPAYPFQIQVGSRNPLIGAGVGTTDTITSSTSIISLPIYDSSMQTFTAGINQVTIIGFLQVFINSVDNFGNVNVTVMNISGCGNAVPSGTAALQGTSPVPVRLTTPQ